VATLIKWFPDKRGMITGLTVAGFGAGALITAPVAEHFDLVVRGFESLHNLGAIYFILVSGSAVFMRNSPDGYRPAGWNPPLNQQQQRSGNDYTLGEALSTWQWYALWAILFFDTLAGISIISQAAPLAQEVTHVSEVAAAGLVGIYGLMLTAWGFAGVLGPTLIAHGRQSTGYYTEALDMIAGVMLLSAVLPFVIRPPRTPSAEPTDTAVDQPKRALNPTH
jgi:hypothetical protein